MQYFVARKYSFLIHNKPGMPGKTERKRRWAGKEKCLVLVRLNKLLIFFHVHSLFTLVVDYRFFASRTIMIMRFVIHELSFDFLSHPSEVFFQECQFVQFGFLAIKKAD